MLRRLVRIAYDRDRARLLRHLKGLEKCGCTSRRPNLEASALDPRDWRAEVCNDCGVGIVTRLTWTDRMIEAYYRGANRRIGCVPCPDPANTHALWTGQGGTCIFCKAVV